MTLRFLQPAELAVIARPQRVKTVLGSCLAIIMRCPRLGVSAMSHCLLPSAGAQGVVLSRGEALRYVDSTIELIMREFARRGASPAELEIKLFGGADPSDWGKSYHVGSSNVRAALDNLAGRGLAPVASDLGGQLGRVIEFDSETGDVFVERLSGMITASVRRPQ